MNVDSKPNLPAHLFWDTNYQSINWERSAGYVIDRVLHRGSWEDFKEILRHYGRERVSTVAQKMRYLDKRVLSFCSVYFDVPIENFRCYTWKQLNPTHWDY